VRPAAEGLSIARAALRALAAQSHVQSFILVGAVLLYLAVGLVDDALIRRTPYPAPSAWVMVGWAVLICGLAAFAFPVIAVGQRVFVIDDLARARTPLRARPSRGSVVVALSWLLVPSAALDIVLVLVILLTVTYVDLYVLRVGVAQFWLGPSLYWVAWMARRLVLGDACAHIVVGGLSARAAFRASTVDLGGRRAASVASRMISVVPVIVGTAIGLIAGASESQTFAIALVVAALVTSFDAAVETEWYRRLHDEVDVEALSAVFD